MGFYLFGAGSVESCQSQMVDRRRSVCTAGENIAIPEYKIGPRWEPSQYATIALTYGHEFAGSLGAGFEFGVMLFTPPFACLGGCGGEKKKLKNMF